MSTRAGFIGLGRMGRPLSEHVADTQGGVLAYDLKPPGGTWPEGWSLARSVEDVASECEVIFLSLPDVTAVTSVANAIVASKARRTQLVIDTSTVGPEGSKTVAELFDAVGIDYIDAPVAGGVRGAKAGTLTVMYSCRKDLREQVDALLAGFSSHRFYVGGQAGLAQVAKLANNYLSATAMAVASEAVAFATALGVDQALMIDILNKSSGRNSATLDKFPNQILTGDYDAGFTSTLLLKDLRLYAEATAQAAVRWPVGATVASLWEEFESEAPGSDMTEVFPYLQKGETQT